MIMSRNSRPQSSGPAGTTPGSAEQVVVAAHLDARLDQVGR